MAGAVWGFPSFPPIEGIWLTRSLCGPCHEAGRATLSIPKLGGWLFFVGGVSMYDETETVSRADCGVAGG